ncbi:hypothetical protein [Achromobacter sp. AONIH1]|uniref:hypothetical protein n=1 Tax=unclassified Achromobacter TaxID=2626865 RepID=UPI000CD1F34F|nr:hypothetical protein [Achromobacter sp. AONIH1]AUT49758.1 hypothetical protein C2U31_29535 [Achromobacter sp. AONIH1]
MHDESRAWALYEDSVLLRFQPVFTAQGQVHEYAVQGRSRASPWQGLAPSGMGASLLAGVAFFNKYELPIDLSVEHAMDMDAEGDPAMRLCGDLGIALTGDALWVNRLVDHDQDGPLSVPARRVTFLLPMNIRLCRQAELFLCYPEFNAKLRARLLPTAIGGVPSTHGVLRALGVRVDIPDGFSENQALQWRFFSLMERAWSANLQLAVHRLDAMRDFAWLRRHGDLLFQGSALSSALSPECLDAWLRADGNAWRSFSAATTRWSQPCSLAA